MKVGYVLDRFPSLHQTFVLEELRELERRGVEVVILSLKRPAGLVQPAAAQLKAPVYYGAPWGRLDRLVAAQARVAARRPRAYASLLPLLLPPRRPALVGWQRGLEFTPLVADRGIEHLHAHFATGANVAAMCLSRLAGVPFSFTVHAVDLFVWPVQLCRTLAAARFVVAISEYNKRFLAQECGPGAVSKVQVIHMGVDVAAFATPRPPDGDPMHILSVGRLVPKKGHRYLVAALAELERRGVAFRATIVGDGPERESLAAAIGAAGLGGRVSLSGALTQEELRGLYQASDVGVLAAVVGPDGDREGIPVTLMEAMAAGRPVVSTTISGIPELVVPEAGILVPPGDVDALADALARLAGAPGLRCRMGECGREAVARRFNVRRNVGRLAELFAASVQRPAAGSGPPPEL